MERFWNFLRGTVGSDTYARFMHKVEGVAEAVDDMVTAARDWHGERKAKQMQFYDLGSHAVQDAYARELIATYEAALTDLPFALREAVRKRRVLDLLKGDELLLEETVASLLEAGDELSRTKSSRADQDRADLAYHKIEKIANDVRIMVLGGALGKRIDHPETFGGAISELRRMYS